MSILQSFLIVIVSVFIIGEAQCQTEPNNSLYNQLIQSSDSLYDVGRFELSFERLKLARAYVDFENLSQEEDLAFYKRFEILDSIDQYIIKDWDRYEERLLYSIQAYEHGRLETAILWLDDVLRYLPEADRTLVTR